MILKDFIEQFIWPNSLIRLWKPHIEGGHEMIYKEDKSKPGDIDEVCMEWEILDGSDWRAEYANTEIIGVTDIVCEGFYREAINIVLKL